MFQQTKIVPEGGEMGLVIDHAIFVGRRFSNVERKTHDLNPATDGDRGDTEFDIFKISSNGIGEVVDDEVDESGKKNQSESFVDQQLEHLYVLNIGYDATTRGWHHGDHNSLFVGSFLSRYRKDEKLINNELLDGMDDYTWLVERADLVKQRMQEAAVLLEALNLPSDNIRLHLIPLLSD